jgi:hypothetical protein
MPRTGSGNVLREAQRPLRERAGRPRVGADHGKDQYAAMGMALALGYLAPDGIGLRPGPDDSLLFGEAVPAPLDDQGGTGYGRATKGDRVAGLFPRLLSPAFAWSISTPAHGGRVMSMSPP